MSNSGKLITHHIDLKKELKAFENIDDEYLIQVYSKWLNETSSYKDILRVYRDLFNAAYANGWDQINHVSRIVAEDYCFNLALKELIKSNRLDGSIKKQANDVDFIEINHMLDLKTYELIKARAKRLFYNFDESVSCKGIIDNELKADWAKSMIIEFFKSNDDKGNYRHLQELVFKILSESESEKFKAALN